MINYYNTCLRSSVIAVMTLTVLAVLSYLQTPASLAFQVTETPTMTVTPVITGTLVIQVLTVATLDLKEYSINANGQLIRNTPTPSWHPTPMPRAVLVPTDTLRLAELPPSHLWFGRAFPDRGAWGTFSYPYGTNSLGNYLWHFGIDVQASFGNVIHAIGDGVVVHAGPDDVAHQLGPWPDFYGRAVVIQHTDPWNGQPVYTLFGHVSATLVQVGQTVKLGDPIAKVGKEGVATGPHLHIEVRVGGNTYAHTRNPDLWIKPDRGFGMVAGRVMDAQGYFVPVQLVKLYDAHDRRHYRRETFSYPNNIVNYDDLYRENFALADVPVGDYIVEATYDGRTLTSSLTISDQQATSVMLQSTQVISAPQVQATSMATVTVQP
jgi:murein DD-endopeptidase MepM/ murein hydrolase activator NlpD